MKAGRNEACPCGSGKKYKNCHEARQNRAFLSRGMIALLVPLVLLFGFAIYASLRRPDATAVTTATPPATSATTAAPATTAANAIAAPAAQSASTPAPQPPGPPPAGKVWSLEHGHWHDAAAPGTANGIQVSSQQIPLTDEQIANLRRLDAMPPSPAPPVASAGGPIAASSPLSAAPVSTPPGKVWSAEHGHFHNAEPPSGVSGVRVLGQPVDPNSRAAEPLLKPAPQPPGPVPSGKVWSAEHGHWHDAPK